MKHKSLLWVSIFILSGRVLTQNRIKKEDCSCQVVLFEKQIEVPILDNKGKLIDYVVDDTLKEDYYTVIISKINHGMAYVDVRAPLYDTIPKIGWIEIKYLGIRPASHQPINLYRKSAKRYQIRSQILKPEWGYWSADIKILDCTGEWLYVSFLDGDNKMKEDWLSPEDQCSNPYSTCN
ncbi:hypothetical protein SDC9_95743 [bioreactor metagenome]|uniref:Uncharacterized protein n=1 Tax=bioreactor metagenome TaxID=1076179 RepID=A0A645A746_9ZZZZ|nr:hypothetical protein [Paludibacter sp.]